jgi:hypothetical protein
LPHLVLNSLTKEDPEMGALEREAPTDLQEQLIRRAWEDKQFADLLRTDPRAAIAMETGVELPDNVDIHVHQEDDKTLHLVVPRNPALSLPEPRLPTSGIGISTAITCESQRTCYCCH